MTSVPSARRIPTACKTPNKHPLLHLPVSCVGGAQRKPLRWRVEEQPCHTPPPPPLGRISIQNVNISIYLFIRLIQCIINLP